MFEQDETQILDAHTTTPLVITTVGRLFEPPVMRIVD